MAHISTTARKNRKRTREFIVQSLKRTTGRSDRWEFVNPTNNEKIVLDALGVEGLLYSIVPAARDAEYKYGPGVARLMLTYEQVNNNYRDAGELNDIVKIIASAHVDEWDAELNGKSIRELIDFFHGETMCLDNEDREEIAKHVLTPNERYMIVEIPDYNTATQYKSYTTWCITSSDRMFDHYSANGMNKVYFLLRDDYADLAPCNAHKKDDYGLSMVSVIVRPHGGLGFCTGRYNHGLSGNDQLMTTLELSQLVGRNYYDIFKPKTGEEIEKVIFENWEVLEPDTVACAKNWKLIKKRPTSSDYFLNSGNVVTYYDPSKRYLVFDSVQPFDENGLAIVKLNGRYNFINRQGDIVFQFTPK
jgi:hypothetical protein